MIVQGSKSGSKKQRQPYVAQDSARSVSVAKILYLIALGEIAGPDDLRRNLYLDGTPLMAENGSENFPGVKAYFRPGTLDQDFIPGFPETSNEISIGVELRSESPWVRSVTNAQINAVRVRLSWPQVQQQNPTTGDVTGYTIQYAIDVATDSGAYQTAVSAEFSDKTTTKYERYHRVELPEGSNWQIRVRRLTANADSSLIADRMYIESFAEVIDAKLVYPGMALVGIEYDAEQFSSIPKMALKSKGQIVDIPSNYDPETRTYAGIWDGTFKRAYTNNPCWCIRDVLLDRYSGTGRRIDQSMINKWELYRISQWCDEFVSDGKGGVEPRYTLNQYLQTREQAHVLLGKLAAVFHGNTYWDGRQVVTVADMPEDSSYTFTPANVTSDGFVYTGTADRERYSTASVSWSNPENLDQTEYEMVWDADAVSKLGVRQLNIDGWGYRSQGQANRSGQWAVTTSQEETQTVSFRVGLDGQLAMPGRIISIADPLLQGRQNGGRIHAATTNEITIDRDDVVAAAGDRLIVNLPSGKAEARVIQSVSGRAITVVADYSETPHPEAVWAIDSASLALMPFRVKSVSRPDETSYEITGLEHAPHKYDLIDHGAHIEPPPTIVVPPGVQAAPTNILISQALKTDQGLSVTTMTISWDAAENAIAYDVEWKRDSGNWVRVPRTGSQSVDVDGVYAGQYLARVRAVNTLGVSSLPATSMLTNIEGKTTPPPVPAFVRTSPIVYGIKVEWGFPAGTDDTFYSELEFSQNSAGDSPVSLGRMAYPISEFVLTNLASGTRLWFRVRLVDKIGNEGAWSAWTEGAASNDVGIIVDSLAGKIGKTQLDPALAAEIEGGGGSATEIQEIRDDLAAMILLKAQYTQDGTPYMAGIAIGVENGGQEIVSQVLFAADRFAFIHPNTNEKEYPFIIEAGKTYISSAFIQNGTIGTAQIAEVLQSVDYVPETSGWQITQAGLFEINGSDTNGARLVIGNGKIRVFDENNNLRVEMGVGL